MIKENVAGNDGGGLYIQVGSTPSILENNTIDKNKPNNICDTSAINM